MIAPSPSLDVLRNGWLDAVATLAPEHPALGDLLDRRVRDAVAAGRLSEEDLLGTVSEIEAAATEAGVTAVSPLVMRLRRTVYEFLLAVDATSAVEAQPAAAGLPPATLLHVVDDDAPAADEPVAEGPDGPVAEEPVGSEPAAPEPLADGPAADEPAAGVTVTDDPVGEVPAEVEAATSEPAAAEPVPEPEPEPGTEPEAADAAAEPCVEPEPEAPNPDAVSTAGSAEPGLAAIETVENPPFAHFRLRRRNHEDFVDPAVLDEADEAAAVFRPDPEPVAPADAGAREATAVATAPSPAGPEPAPTPFMAPRDGFHITDDTHAFAEVERPELPEPADADPDVVAGWRVRENTAGARRDAEARGDVPRPATDQPDDPFETDSRLFEERRRIEDRLRRKKCDEAAAMLQSMAQETGGRAVAELAMDAGDRCRGLGKTNAALNCYLAASRADPIFELPLHRLADICIDDQDIDLAVSYLERIARLHQLRGDSTGALRVYRRIVTVAPYREDILAMLMNARTTGQMPS